MLHHGFNWHASHDTSFLGELKQLRGLDMWLNLIESKLVYLPIIKTSPLKIELIKNINHD